MSNNTHQPIQAIEHGAETNPAPASERGGGADETDAEARPPDPKRTVSAYEVLQNPFLDKNAMFILNVQKAPAFEDGTKITNDYRTLGILMLTGIQALQFKRMLSPDDALYSAYGLDIYMAADTSAPKLLGQIVVVILPGSLARGVHPATNSDWEVQPAGTTTGTNGFGAPITLPVVKFWGYAKAHQKQERGVGSAGTPGPTLEGGAPQPSPGENASPGVNAPSPKSAGQPARSSSSGTPSGAQTAEPPAPDHTDPPENPTSTPAGPTSRAPQPGTVEIPAGRTVEALVPDLLASNASPGDILQGTLEIPVMVGNKVALPQGTDIYMRVLRALPGQGYSGAPLLTLTLDHLDYQGQTYPVNSTHSDLMCLPQRLARVSRGTKIQFELLGGVTIRGNAAAANQ